jgi:hypothetical protein
VLLVTSDDDDIVTLLRFGKIIDIFGPMNSGLLDRVFIGFSMTFL